MTNKPSRHYKKRVDVLNSVINDCLTVSRACAGIRSPTSSHYYASVLFTLLCTRAISIAILAPHSPWAKKPIENWDYASISVLARSLLEIRLAYFYLCTEVCSEDEWRCRWNIFNISDCTSRIRLFKELPSQGIEVSGFEAQLQELRSRLNDNTFFAKIPDNEKKKFLNGNAAYLSSLENVAARAGIDVDTFRFVYKFASVHVHGLPMSFYRIGEQDRGRGIYSEPEEGYTALFLSFTSSILTRSRDEMKNKFSRLMR